MASNSLQTLSKNDVISIVRNYLKTGAFSDRKVTDTPTDALEVVNRKYVTLNGTSANRPRTSVVGRFYLDTTIGRPLWWSGSNWIDGVGSVH